MGALKFKFTSVNRTFDKGTKSTNFFFSVKNTEWHSVRPPGSHHAKCKEISDGETNSQKKNREGWLGWNTNFR